MSDNSHTLPERPSLEQLRKQARELQQQEPGMLLSEAQRRIARRYGFTSWSKLKSHVEATLGLKDQLYLFVEAALGGRLDAADAILSEHPGLRSEPVVAALYGMPDRELDPVATYGPKVWPLLLYVCFSRYHQRPERRPALLQTATQLLFAGADPDSFYIDETYPEPPETCLYGASGLNNHPELVQLLLRHGANATDLEALYHSTEHRDLRCLRLILEAGANPKGANCVAHMLDYDDLEGLRLILEHYGNPDEDLGRAVHHAIIRHRSAEHVRLLLQYGADPNHVMNGFSAYLRARFFDRPEIAEMLAQAGAQTNLTDAEQFVVACISGEETPAPIEIPRPLQAALSYVAAAGRIDAMKRLLNAGCDPDARAEWGRTGLHHAGWMGQAEAVEVLLEAGASLAVKDPHHDGTPLNWTVAGAAWKIRPEGDHVGAARAMLERGAAEYCSAAWVLELSKEMPEMRSLLEEFGVGAGTT